MRLTIAAVCLLALAAVAQAAAPRQDWKSDLLSAREAVWVNYYSDPDKLAAGLSDDLITISGRGSGFEGKAAAIASSRRAVADGTRLRRIVFPRTEIQRYDGVAIIYAAHRMASGYGAVMQQNVSKRRLQAPTSINSLRRFYIIYIMRNIG